jgi:DNA-binding NarL/FixJ family response regulator
MKTNLKRIILADENRLFIESLKTVIERMDPQNRIINTAQDGSDTLKKTKKEQPDIVLLDINLPGIYGPDFIKLIKNESPKTKIVILTTNDDFLCVEESLKNEVSGYFLKDIPLSELITLLPLISDKTTILSRELVPLFFSPTASPVNDRINDSKKKGASRVLPSEFSNNEKKLLDLVIQGLSNREIAEKMYLAEQTVKNYISILYAKLGVHNRSEAIRTAKSILS